MKIFEIIINFFCFLEDIIIFIQKITISIKMISVITDSQFSTFSFRYRIVSTITISVTFRLTVSRLCFRVWIRFITFSWFSFATFI